MAALSRRPIRLRLRSKTASRLIGLAGLLLLGASLAADTFAGVADAYFGGKQLTGCFIGAGLLAIGVLLQLGPGVATGAIIRWLLVVNLTACSLTLSLLWPAENGTLVLLGYIAAVCILLPLPFGIFTLLGVVTLQLLLAWISTVKTALTGLPLTVMDLKLALAYPAGLWEALAMPHWTRYLATAVLLLALLCWLAIGLVSTARPMLRHTSRPKGADLPARALAVVILSLLALSYFDTLHATAAKSDLTWDPEAVSGLANSMGVFPFLTYSHRLGSQFSGDIYQDGRGASPPRTEEIREAVLRYVDFEAGAASNARVPPNILVVLAESTFDPGTAFRLQGNWNNELFQRHEHTESSGILRVNAVGGGTWITEFETLIGLDSRLFGYSGMYTHTSLSPFVTRSLVTYLRERGYQTWAFLPHSGEFYDSRNAYKSYGFERVLDSTDLELSSTWTEIRDIAVADSVRATLGPAPDPPFFGYVLLLENHAPHECDLDDDGTFTVRFADTLDFTPNCELHEYLRRLDSTTSAVRSLTAYLASMEHRTGRPWVLLVFGDHQPSTFTSTTDTQYNYSALRKPPDAYTTFFHFMSSEPRSRLQCCSVAPPATVLPSLLSAFIASTPDDVYMGVNLWLYAQCGSDAVRSAFGGWMSDHEAPVLEAQTQACKSAYDRALAWYRSSGVMRLSARRAP